MELVIVLINACVSANRCPLHGGLNTSIFILYVIVNLLVLNRLAPLYYESKT